MSVQQKASDYGVALEPGTVRFERQLPGPIERIWAYLTDSEMRGKWLASGPMEPRVGGKVEFVFRHAELSPIQDERPAQFTQDEVHSTGCVTRYDPPHLLSFTWGEGETPSEVTFELTPQGNEVLLVLTHRKLANRAEMVEVAGGWHTHLGVLVDQANGRVPRPFWTEWRRVNGDHDEAYEKRFPAE